MIEAENDILDSYECKHCEGLMIRRIIYDNVSCQYEIKYCPFCGEKYEESR